MEINSTGIKKSDLTDYLGFWTEKLREVFGNNYIIKKEGVVDNIATSGSLTCLALEDVIMYLAKQMNPYTAEGEYQDMLYSYIGLERRYADFTVVTRTIQGGANITCPVGSVRFKNNATDDIFELNTEVTTDGTGKAVGSFTAIELGSIDLQPSDTLSIIDAPDGITSVYYTEGNVTNIGDDYEDDSEFRLRWLATKSVLPTSKTEGGLRTALLDLVESDNDLLIRQNRTTSTVDGIPAHCMNIVIKSGYSDTAIAQKILDHLTDGVGLVGVGISGVEDVSETLQDSEGTDVDIIFTRPQEVPIYFNVTIQTNDGMSIDESAVKSAITNNFNYMLGEKVVANDFYEYINKLDFVDYVDTLQVSLNGTDFYNVRELQYYQYSTVIASNITVGEAE